MYRCDLCSEVAPPGTPAERVVIDVRPARFPTRARCQTTGLRKHRFKRSHWRDDPGGEGHQIVREAQVCPACARATAAARAELTAGLG
ncbi:MAG: hypothetical protein KC549_07705 [Myxococcales bacterium]|nr:hypothetical protein [Myxococcales bacterium]MCB9548526.1 hypothetical protein [Myxococcales bacterium]